MRTKLLLFLLSTSLFGLPIGKTVDQLLTSVVKIKIQQSDTISYENDLIQSESGGSGFVMDDDNNIITNEHVVRNAKKIFIVSSDGTEHIASLVASDDKSDIAVIFSSSFQAPKPTIASTLPAIGDTIYALGAPYSLGSSLSFGILSATKRTLQNYPYLHYFQTDAAVNSGNSGGALLNDQGEVIGVVAMTFLKSGGYTNIGFAIPIDEALSVATALLKDKNITRGYLGAKLLISDKLSRKLGYPHSTIVSEVIPNSPAAIANLRSGDIIIAVNGTKFKDANTLHRLLYTSKPKETIELTLVREKKTLTTQVILGNQVHKSPKVSNAGLGDASEKLGLIVNENGGEVMVVLTHGISKTMGILPNDTLLTVDNITIKSIKELNTQLSKLSDNGIGLLTLKRQGEMITIPIGSKTSLAVYSTAN
jgi:serine protease Do